nr:tetratricopeptide repeat protein [Streptomyces sp. HNM0574]
MQGDEAAERFAEAGECYRRAEAEGGEEGNLWRAFALLERHTGRALWVRGELTESRARLTEARTRFEREGDHYNLARTLTDLAETAHAAGDDTEALDHLTAAARLLPEDARPHLRYLTDLRRRCEAAL